MTRIVVRFKDERPDREFPEGSRSGGSWDNSVQYVQGMVVVTDVYETRYAWPQEDVSEVQVTPRPHW